MRTIYSLSVILLIISCNSSKFDEIQEKKQVNATIDAWHIAAADANYKNYFDLMDSDAFFIGTDAVESWNKKDFEIFAKPRFEQHKAWKMKALERKVFLDTNGKVAWFDELLITRFKICRGSGVLVKTGKDWKIKHYVLSLTIPNDVTEEIVKIKTPIENTVIENLTQK